MSDVHFEFEGYLDRTTPQRIKVTVNRETHKVTIRALHDRTVYEADFRSMVRSEVEKQSRIKALESKRPRKLKVNRGLLRP